MDTVLLMLVVVVVAMKVMMEVGSLLVVMTSAAPVELSDISTVEGSKRVQTGRSAAAVTLA